MFPISYNKLHQVTIAVSHKITTEQPQNERSTHSGAKTGVINDSRLSRVQTEVGKTERARKILS